ncbi:MAG: hypothetical protein H6733_13960 [Alphaproteobacteria bacterium]|nr:hypothetical protein [Alphaproteobacteria bacterium]
MNDVVVKHWMREAENATSVWLDCATNGLIDGVIRSRRIGGGARRHREAGGAHLLDGGGGVGHAELAQEADVVAVRRPELAGEAPRGAREVGGEGLTAGFAGRAAHDVGVVGARTDPVDREGLTVTWR